MKRAIVILLAAIAAISATNAHAQLCAVPYEFCQLGCPDIGSYSIASFGSMAEAAAFIGTLNGVQQETVRITVFPAYSAHIVVAYRVLATERPHDTAPIGLSCSTSLAVMRGYVSIETAEVEINQLPLAQRASAAIVAATAVPNDPNTRALLIFRTVDTTVAGDQGRR